MKNVLIINGHPNPNSYCNALHEAYKNAAEKTGALIDEIKIRSLNFDVNLKFGYSQRIELEPDLLDAQQKILRADHIVIIYPVWWGSYPAIMKGFIDRVFLPGFAFNKRENSVWWDKLLKGKTARIISTADQPGWYYKWVNKQSSIVSLKKLTFDFVGITKCKSTFIGPVRNSSDIYRAKWIKKIGALGQQLK